MTMKQNDTGESSSIVPNSQNFIMPALNIQMFNQSTLAKKTSIDEFVPIFTNNS